MKKNLLALFALGAIYSAYAQDTNIKDAVIVKINPNTLFYNGGTVNVTTDAASATTEKIINQGNIQIKGGFTNTNTNGKNFVNKYTNDNSFGQLIIQNATTVTGRVAIERSIPDVNNDEYVISLPFKNVTAKEVVNSLTGGNFFKGDCKLNTNCGNSRYLQSILFWDVNETEYDAIDDTFVIDPKFRYLLNLRAGTAVDNAIISLGTANPIKFAGIPNNNSTDFALKSGLRGGAQDFGNLTWKDWKGKINNYNETYDSYIGNKTGTLYDASQIYGKNQHRLSNPFTSNIDLSDIGKVNTWIRFTGATGGTAPTEVFAGALRFRVTKIANDFTIKWNANSGNVTTSSSTPISAYLTSDGAATPTYIWTGNPQALIVKPYESFYIDYHAINSAGNGGTRIVNANVKLTDSHKTFNYNFNSKNPNANGFPNGTFAKTQNESNSAKQALLNDDTLKQKGLVTDFDFTQVELFLSKNNKFEGTAAYLLNANFMVSGNATNNNTITNPIFFYEENSNGEVIKTAQTLSNSFNSVDYIAKPIRLGFNDLENGQEYTINMNLYEYSILNQVDKLGLGKYYILDKKTNKTEVVDANTKITFVADNTINDRYEFYWNALPESLSTNDNLTSKNVTYLYSNNGNQYIKFEQNNTTADIAVYDLAGRQISYKTNVSTNNDHQLNLVAAGVYLVKISYKDGKVVTKKTINK